MNLENYEMFSRQVPFLGEEKQDKLSGGRVVVVGAGGLGSFVSSMLIRLGVGFVRVIDRDIVDESNLARVSVYTRNDLGKSKASTVKERFGKLNTDSRVDGIMENLMTTNAGKLLAGFDAVVDCTDNMESRYVINRFCMKNGIPWVYGSVLRDEGFSSTFPPSGRPCFSCIYPKMPEELETSEQVGVISPIIGMIASWQVMEVVKILTGISKPNYSKLLRITLKKPKFEFLNIKFKGNCRVCG